MLAYSVTWTGVTADGLRRSHTMPPVDGWQVAYAAADALRLTLRHPSRVVVLDDGRPVATYVDGERVDQGDPPPPRRHVSTEDAHDAAPEGLSISVAAKDALRALVNARLVRRGPRRTDYDTLDEWLRSALAGAHPVNRPQDSGRALYRAGSSHGRVYLVMEGVVMIAVLPAHGGGR